MIKNRYRGEISVTLDGCEWILCLTLGALAELEERMNEQDVGALARRFASGRLSAKDMQAIIAAGLRGGGHDVSDDEVAEMRSDNGIVGYAKIVAELLTATFSDSAPDSAMKAEETSLPNPPRPQKAPHSPGK